MSVKQSESKVETKSFARRMATVAPAVLGTVGVASLANTGVAEASSLSSGGGSSVVTLFNQLLGGILGFVGDILQIPALISSK